MLASLNSKKGFFVGEVSAVLTIPSDMTIEKDGCYEITDNNGANRQILAATASGNYMDSDGVEYHISELLGVIPLELVTNTAGKWLGRVFREKEVTIELRENELFIFFPNSFLYIPLNRNDEDEYYD